MTRRSAFLTMPVVLERRAPAALALALLLGLVGQFLFFRQPLGVNVPVITAGFLLAAWTLRAPPASVRGIDAWLPAGALAFAMFCAIRSDAPLLAFDSLASVGLALATVAAWSGVPVSALPIAALIAEGWSQAERAILGAADVLVPA